MVRLGRWPVPVASRVLNQEISTLWRFSVLGHERRNLLSISACKDRLQMIRCLPCELEISLPQYGLKQASLKLRRHVFRPASEAGRGRPSGPALPSMTLSHQQQQLVETFAHLHDAQERLSWLLDQARKRPMLDLALRTDAN